MTETREKDLAAPLHHHAAGCDLPRYVSKIRFAEALARGDDPLHVLPYFADAGVKITSLEGVFAACNDPAEEELEAYRVEEGVAVHVAIDDQWLVFTR
ncbi:hypothetical protein [Acidocella sp.]|uniref:hypothetical protein n=1 Tax=Acidocella sp. TaxID=50710 RepID=UPI002F4110D4